MIDQVSAQTVFGRLLHTHGTLMRAVEARLRTEHGLSANDFETLLHLARDEHGALRRVDLADRLRLTPSGVTRLLDGLEEAGLTGRRACATDARVTYSVITDDGREMLRRASCTHAAVCEELIGTRLSPAELDELSGLLARLPGGDECDAGCTAGTQQTG